MIEKVVFSWSGGKDSAYALHKILKDEGYEVFSLLTNFTDDYDRITMHGVRRELIEQQIESIGLNNHLVYTSKESTNEEYEEKSLEALEYFKNLGVTKVVYGDIFLEDVKKYRERLLKKAGMEGIFPLWGMDTKELISDFVKLGFKCILVCCDPRHLNVDYSGRIIDGNFTNDLPDSVDPCGENGEFHTFVFDGPIFNKKVMFEIGETVEKSSFLYRDLIPAQ